MGREKNRRVDVVFVEIHQILQGGWNWLITNMIFYLKMKKVLKSLL